MSPSLLTSMHPLDLAFAAMIFVPALWGLWRGVIRGLAGPLALAVGAGVAWSSGAELGRWALGVDPLAPVFGAALGFAAGWLGLRALGAGLARLARESALGWLDRLSGAALAGAAGAALCVWALSGALRLELAPRAWVEGGEGAPVSLRVVCGVGGPSWALCRASPGPIDGGAPDA